MKSTVLEFLEESCEKFGLRKAVEDENGFITYDELHKISLSVCSYIQNRTQEKRKPIMVILPKDRLSIPVFMGILYSGNIYSPSEIDYPIARLLEIIGILRPALIITNSELKSKLELNQEVPNSILIDIKEIENKDISVDKTYYMNIISTDPVYILFTSGSTGTPKGVVINNQNIIDYIEWVQDTFHFDESDVVGSQAPFYFDNSTLDIYISILNGACLNIIPKYLFGFPFDLVNYIIEKKITSIFWVPSVLTKISEAKALENCKTKLKRILFAGEVLQTKHLNYWMDMIKDATFANLYGPTEITVDCTYYIVKQRLNEDHPIPIGFPCRNSRVFLVDNHGKMINESEIYGEIVVEGIGVSSGYWNNPGENERHFRQNPIITEYSQKVYYTGDLGYYNDKHELVFAGRMDSQIKHMGYRIELGEIESAICKMNGVVFAQAIYKNERILLICTVNGSTTEKDIKKHAKMILPKYMIPSNIIIIDDMPLNSNGKIDRKKLESTYG